MSIPTQYPHEDCDDDMLSNPSSKLVEMIREHECLKKKMGGSINAAYLRLELMLCMEVTSEGLQDKHVTLAVSKLADNDQLQGFTRSNNFYEGRLDMTYYRSKSPS